MATAKPSNVPAGTRPTVRVDQAEVKATKSVPVTDEKAEVIGIIPGKKKASPGWLRMMYDRKLITLEELIEIYDNLRYITFDRDLMLYKLELIVKDPKVAIQIVIACALRGPQAAARLKLREGKTISEYGIPGSGRMGTEDLSCQRIAAATADLAAHYMKILNVPKRINELDCPGWLQFPSAGAIKLPEHLRAQHKLFAEEFSKRIGGVFRPDIYQQMQDNSYLDPDLHLFE